MRIAIVGSGVSGLVCGYLLHREHDITVFEAARRVGGHINTSNVELDGASVSVDTGFIVFNDRNYPNFVGLLDELNVPSRPTEMSFSVRCERCGLEYNGSSLNGLFAQRRNLARPGFHRMLRDVLRFNREACDLRDDLPADLTVGRFLREHGYSQTFAEHYLLPMGAAIWSCPMETFEEFPIGFIIEFYSNHGLLQLRDRPVWRTVVGGSASYAKQLFAGFAGCIRLGCPVHSIRRTPGEVLVQSPRGTESFDEVILACHSDQALALLDPPTSAERDVLAAFPYGHNTAVLHTDARLLPRRERAWASWNYHVREEAGLRPSVTYNMNILQGIESRRPLCVTLNESEAIAPDQILREFQYEHPVFTTARATAQGRHQELTRQNRTSFAGAYWGNGFHEDGVNSGLTVCEAFGIVPAWSTRKGTTNANPGRTVPQVAYAR